MPKYLNYWISPSGEARSTGMMGHTERAFDIIEENGWDDDYDEYRHNHFNGYPHEYMENEKGYRRIMQWFSHPAPVVVEGFNLTFTTAQVKKIVELFTDHGYPVPEVLK